MSFVTIHETGADALRVDSWFNGEAYAIHFGEGGAPSRTLWLQGDGATEIRDHVEALESMNPNMEARKIWLHAIDTYT